MAFESPGPLGSARGVMLTSSVYYCGRVFQDAPESCRLLFPLPSLRYVCNPLPALPGGPHTGSTSIPAARPIVALVQFLLDRAGSQSSALGRSLSLASKAYDQRRSCDSAGRFSRMDDKRGLGTGRLPLAVEVVTIPALPLSHYLSGIYDYAHHSDSISTLAIVCRSHQYRQDERNHPTSQMEGGHKAQYVVFSVFSRYQAMW